MAETGVESHAHARTQGEGKCSSAQVSKLTDCLVKLGLHRYQAFSKRGAACRQAAADGQKLALLLRNLTFNVGDVRLSLLHDSALLFKHLINLSRAVAPRLQTLGIVGTRRVWLRLSIHGKEVGAKAFDQFESAQLSHDALESARRLERLGELVHQRNVHEHDPS